MQWELIGTVISLCRSRAGESQRGAGFESLPPGSLSLFFPVLRPRASGPGLGALSGRAGDSERASGRGGGDARHSQSPLSGASGARRGTGLRQSLHRGSRPAGPQLLGGHPHPRRRDSIRSGRLGAPARGAPHAGRTSREEPGRGLCADNPKRIRPETPFAPTLKTKLGFLENQTQEPLTLGPLPSAGRHQPEAPAEHPHRPPWSQRAPPCPGAGRKGSSERSPGPTAHPDRSGRPRGRAAPPLGAALTGPGCRGCVWPKPKPHQQGNLDRVSNKQRAHGRRTSCHRGGTNARSV